MVSERATQSLSLLITFDPAVSELNFFLKLLIINRVLDKSSWSFSFSRGTTCLFGTAGANRQKSRCSNMLLKRSENRRLIPFPLRILS